MLCNMFFYVVQHIFGRAKKCISREASMTLHFLHILSQRQNALFAVSCRRMYKKHRYEIDNAPSPERRKGGLAPLSCPRGNGAHGAR